MSIIKIFSGAFCHGDEICREVSKATGLELIDDKRAVKEAAKDYGASEGKLFKTLACKVSAFNNFTHEKERNISSLKLYMADLVERDNFIFTGFLSHLIPSNISHVLSVCLIAEMNYRLEIAKKESGLSSKDAHKAIQKEDESAALWTQSLVNKDPWDSDIYDILIPTGKTSVEDAVKLIAEQASSAALQTSESSLQAVRDFKLAAQTEARLVKAGHNVGVSAENGKIILTINKHTLMLASLEAELTRLAKKVEGVAEVETKVGPGFYQAGMYRQFNVDLPSKVLLVDDEREFVQTLSERLEMRDMGSAVVYDGEQALSFVQEEEPEVIVLDLKMPGIDGIEVLRRIKQERPAIEVIVLTGHGSKKDEERCMELGAFAYLQKPVDLEKLSQTMQDAYKKIRSEQKDE